MKQSHSTFTDGYTKTPQWSKAVCLHLTLLVKKKIAVLCKVTPVHILAACKKKKNNVTAIDISDCLPDVISYGKAQSGYYFLLFLSSACNLHIHSPSSLAIP